MITKKKNQLIPFNKEIGKKRYHTKATQEASCNIIHLTYQTRTLIRSEEL